MWSFQKPKLCLGFFHLRAGDFRHHKNQSADKDYRDNQTDDNVMADFAFGEV